MGTPSVKNCKQRVNDQSTLEIALREAEAPLVFFAMDAKEERRLLQTPVWTGAWRSALFAADMEAIAND